MANENQKNAQQIAFSHCVCVRVCAQQNKNTHIKREIKQNQLNIEIVIK